MHTHVPMYMRASAHAYTHTCMHPPPACDMLCPTLFTTFTHPHPTTVSLTWLSHCAVIRGFVARRQFTKLQLASEQQARVVAALLRHVPLPTQAIYQRLQHMNEQDEKRPKGDVSGWCAGVCVVVGITLLTMLLSLCLCRSETTRTS